jgi:hypothetical protein
MLIATLRGQIPLEATPEVYEVYHAADEPLELQ